MKCQFYIEKAHDDGETKGYCDLDGTECDTPDYPCTLRLSTPDSMSESC